MATNIRDLLAIRAYQIELHASSDADPDACVVIRVPVDLTDPRDRAIVIAEELL